MKIEKLIMRTTMKYIQAARQGCILEATGYIPPLTLRSKSSFRIQLIVDLASQVKRVSQASTAYREQQ